jgi:branched-chain amino acid transport system substrate-binding protein
MHNKFINLLLIILLSHVIISCQTNTEVNHKTKTEGKNTHTEAKLENHKIKAMVILPLSGSNKNIGDTMLKSIQMAIEDCNNDKIEIDIIDSGSPGYNPINIINRAKLNNTNIILGPLFYEQAKLLNKLTKDSGIPIISYSNNISLSDEGALILGYTPEEQINFLIKHLHNDNIDTIYLLAPNNSYGETILKALRRVSNESLIKIAKIESYNDADNFKLALKNIIEDYTKTSSSNNAILVAEGGDKINLVAQTISNFKHNNFNILGLDQWDGGYIENMPKNARVLHIKIHKNNYFANKYYNLFGSKPSLISALAYDSIVILNKLSYKNNYTEESILEEPRYNGAEGSFRFDQNGFAIHDLSVGTYNNID